MKLASYEKFPSDSNRPLWEDGSYSIWISNPLDEGPMKRLNSFPIYDLGTKLERLRELKETTKVKDVFFRMWQAQSALLQFLKDQYIPLPFSRPDGQKLMNTMSSVVSLGKPPDDMEKELGNRVFPLRLNLNAFEHVLSAELSQLDTYYVPQVSIYSTNALMERADDFFLDKQHLNEQSRFDIRESGKCLACQIPTAAGFHIWRATESVLIEYFKLVAGREPKESERNWGAYTKILLEHGGDTKVCAAIDQIREFHRNPISHPEVNLTMNEADSLLGIAKHAIVAMTMDMEKRKNATASASSPAPAVAAAALAKKP